MSALAIQYNHPLSFAEHVKSGSIKSCQRAQKLKLLMSGALVISAVIASVLLTISSFGLIPIALALPIASVSILLPTLAFIYTAVKSTKLNFATHGILNRSDQTLKVRNKDYQTSCQAIPCVDTEESFQWKKRLIEQAEHNILISGNYCGGKAFHEVLNLIDAQMASKTSLKVIILSSCQFLKSDHYEKLKSLTHKYKNRFNFVKTSDQFRMTPCLERISNHTKALVIDYGKYFMLGGSGMEDKYAYKKGTEGHPSSSKPADKEKSKSKSCLERFLPEAFRDFDFAFKSKIKSDAGLPKQSLGNRLYDEMLKLTYRWENICSKKETSEQNSLAQELLEASIPDYKCIKTKIPEFASDSKKTNEAKMELFFTGPEHKDNPFLKKMIEQINKTGKGDEIFVDHLYFHPPKSLEEAWIAAIKRGAKLSLVTNGNGKANRHSKAVESPGSHSFFAARNRYHYSKLVSKLPKQHQDQVSIYEFAVPRTTLHRKAIVIDSPKEDVACVIAGSSNIGYRSLEINADHEVNFISHSKPFVDQTMKVLSEDLRYSEKVKDTSTLYRKVQARAFCQKLLAPYIG